MVPERGRRRRWGQHFLIDANIRKRIVEEGALSHEDIVVEIGVGEGFLTELFLQRAGWVVGFEIDTALVDLVKEKFAGFSNFSFYPEDFLRIDLKTCLASFPFPRKKCVSNLPYSISTPVFLKLFGENIAWDLLLLMVQREFGERVLAFPPQGKGGLLSLAAHLRFEVKKVLSVAPCAFRPNPQVESVVLKFSPRRDQIDFPSAQQILNLARFLFSQKRKSLLALLEAKVGSRAEVLGVLERAHVLPYLRAEDLDRFQWIALAEAFQEVFPLEKRNQNGTIS